MFGSDVDSVGVKQGLPLPILSAGATLLCVSTRAALLFARNPVCAIVVSMGTLCSRARGARPSIRPVITWLMGLLVMSGLAGAWHPSEAVDVLATATKTATPTKTPTATPIHADLYEPNNDFNSATPISVGGSLSNLTFWPQGDTDYFKFWGKASRTYQVQSTVNPGLDSYMRIYGPAGAGQLLGENDDVEPGNLGSRVIIMAPTDGFYFVELTNRDPTDPVGRTYQLGVDEVPGTPSVTPTPTDTVEPEVSATPSGVPSAIPGADAMEPNYDFEHARVLGAGVQYDNLNFVPWAGSDPNQPDNDFFRIWVKPGLFFSCETFNLSPGTDTNMILYLGPSFEQGGPGNDDRAPGDYSSQVSWYSTFTGWLYILVGPRWAGIPPDQLAPFTYSLECSLDEAPTLTPLPPTRTPWPTSSAPLPTYTPVPTYTPYPSATPQPTGVVQAPSPTQQPSPTPPPIPLSILPLPTATPAGPALRVITIDILIYYDANENLNPELEEGIRDLAVAVYDTVGSELVAFGYTSESGGLHFGPLSVTGVVRVEVPFLGYSRRVSGTMEQIEVRIAPQPLPEDIP